MEFNGQLGANIVLGSLYNMIISQRVYAKNIASAFGELAKLCKVDGSMYGDTKLYYATDVLKSIAWGNDAEATNLLQLHRPPEPKVQKIVMDTFRQIAVTVDNYLTKQAWGDENAFSEFNSVVLGWIGETKRIYDATLINSFIGTAKKTKGKQSQSIQFKGVAGDLEATNRLEGQMIGEKVANILVEVKDISRDYNDYEFLRSYDTSDLRIVWNSAFKNRILKIDLPTIFHKEGILDKLEEVILPERYFGTINEAGGTTGVTNISIRSLIEKDYADKHVFPGDLLPANTKYEANETYTEDNKIICKIMHKDALPFMSGFETGTNFFNPKSLTDTHYLTWGHNTLELLDQYPFITLEGIDPIEPAKK